MTIRNIKSFFKNNFPLSLFIFKNKAQIINLGRWGVICDKAKGIVTDNANQDHCGPCGTHDFKTKHQEIDKNIQFYKNKNIKK